MTASCFDPILFEVAEVRWFDARDLLTMPDLLESNRQLLQSFGSDWLSALEEGHRSPATKEALSFPSALSPQSPALSPASTSSAWANLQEQLEDRRRRGMYRSLRTVSSPAGWWIRFDASQEALNFASNDYLGWQPIPA